MTETMPAPSCVSASHAVLFESAEARCSVCSELLQASHPTDDEDAPVPSRGHGLLVWARGDERRYEEPELCPRCAQAIGITAIHRWQIEQHEG